MGLHPHSVDWQETRALPALAAVWGGLEGDGLRVGGQMPSAISMEIGRHGRALFNKASSSGRRSESSFAVLIAIPGLSLWLSLCLEVT